MAPIPPTNGCIRAWAPLKYSVSSPARMTVFFNPLNGLIPFRPDYPNSLLIILCQGRRQRILEENVRPRERGVDGLSVRKCDSVGMQARGAGPNGSRDRN